MILLHQYYTQTNAGILWKILLGGEGSVLGVIFLLTGVGGGERHSFKTNFK